MLDQRYQKTEAGRAEIKSRALVNGRVTRNLLLVIDAGKTGAEWLGLVQGATPADLEQLLQHGLIAAAGAATAAGAAPAAAVAASAPVFAGELPSLDYQELYAYLTRHAKQYLGLIKGYKVILEVERCGTLAELQAYALRFVDMVREAQGDELARQVRRALGMHV